MKQINNYIQEKLKLNKSVINKNHHTLFPKTKEELLKMIKEEIKENGNECSLNHIDVSNIKDMSNLFSSKNKLFYFNGDISDWDVSNVKTMQCMFNMSNFNGKNSDLSRWNVSNVENMYAMFSSTEFNGDISEWDVSNVKTMEWMFAYSQFNQDISKWKINPECSVFFIFADCYIKETYKPMQNGRRITK